MQTGTIEAVIAQYDQDLAELIDRVKKLGLNMGLIICQNLMKEYEANDGNPEKICDNFLIEMAMLGLTTCMVAVKQQEEFNENAD